MVFGNNKSFKSKKVGEQKNYKGFKDILRNDLKTIIKVLLVIFSVAFVFVVSGYLFDYAKKGVGFVSNTMVNVFSKTVGEELKKDELGQINVLLLGYGGEDHQGTFLTDTIMIASYNPNLGAVTFLSIPRDFYVEYNSRYSDRINGVFGYTYNRTKNLDEAAKAIMKKVTEITDIPLDYYVGVDFAGFRNFVDSIGGVEIDVPYDLVDIRYPDNNWGYTTFKLNKGLQTLDGETALKYARSRHSTSDFSRTLRQQQIIKALISKVMSSGNLSSVSNLKSLYARINDVVKTNISIKQIIGLIPYKDDLKHFFSYVYSYECDESYYERMVPACLLYTPMREWFDGKAVLLPNGATINNIDYYKDMQTFAFFVIYNQGFLIEDQKIVILNGININKRGRSGIANELAVKLTNLGFNIESIGNYTGDDTIENTVVYKNTDRQSNNTLELLKAFVDIDQIYTGSIDQGDNLTIILGNNYLK